MNVTQRAPWLALTRVQLPKPFDGNMGLCHFCKYANWIGSCQEPDLDCKHPLEAIAEGDWGDHPFNVWTGSDCWGFRPKKSIEVSADIVGLFLQGKGPYFEEVTT